MSLRRSLALVLVVLAVLPASAQQNRLIPPDDWMYQYIERLQRRGHLLELNPTALPYTQREVLQALDNVDQDVLSEIEGQWFDLLQRELRPTDSEDGDLIAGGSLSAGVVATNNDRLDPLRPTEAGDPHILWGQVRVFPNAGLRLFVERENVIAHLGLQHNVFYDVDPDGIDAANRLYTRSEDSYLGYNGRFVKAYLGRFSNHWAPAGDPALIISDNPRSYDQIALRIGGQKLAIRSLLGELDDITGDGRFTGRAGDASNTTGSKRRFVAAHRLDWRPLRNLTLSLQESSLFSGEQAGFSLKYLNPIHALAFIVDDTPKNEENNGMIGGLLWAQWGNVTLHAQGLLDDFDFMGNSTEPASYALAGSLIYATPIPAIDVGARLEAVASRAYNTPQPEGKYLYLKRGLGTQFSDYILTTGFVDVYLYELIPGLSVSPQVQVLHQGSRDIRQPYPENSAATILDGPDERTVRLALKASWQPQPWWWVRVDWGRNAISNSNNDTGDSRAQIITQIEVGARIRLNRPVHMSLN